MFNFLFRRKKQNDRNKEDLETECTICMDDIKEDDYITKCQHRFHKKCLNDWISIYSNIECPICRKNLGLYVFETKKQRKHRLKKEEQRKHRLKKERELTRQLEEHYRLQIQRERLENIKKNYQRENRKKRKQFEEILKVFQIKPTRSINLKYVNFVNCVDLKQFIKERTDIKNEEKTGTCRFCKTSTYKNYQISNRNIFHKECYKIYHCSRIHLHHF